GVVRLHGHRPDAKEEFAAASWTALTSTHEGFGMAVAEAMSGGCVPFAYDIPYGPADLLAALPGHLASNGDVDGLASRIAASASASEAERESRRRRVEEEAAAYAPERVAAAWRDLVAELAAEPEPPAAGEDDARLRALRVRRTPAAVEIEADF